MLATVCGDADESMDMVRLGRRHAQNTLTTEMISGSLFHGHAHEHNQLPDELVPWNRKSNNWNASSPSWVADLASTILGRISDEVSWRTQWDHEDHEGSVNHTTSGRVGRERWPWTAVATRSVDGSLGSWRETWWCGFATSGLPRGWQSLASQWEHPRIQGMIQAYFSSTLETWD